MTAKKRNKSIGIVFVAALSLLIVVGCKKKQETPVAAPTAAQLVTQPKPIAQKPISSSKRVPVVQAQLSTNKKATVTQMDFSNRKDPFKPGIVEVKQVAKGTAKEVVINMNLLPIQRVEVEKFKVTGIIAGLKENRALILDPEGKAYVAKTGMLIGPNNGKVVRITSNTVEIEENFKDDSGRLKKRTVKLALQRKK
jgi:type IV pilus assembly protein PilP